MAEQLPVQKPKDFAASAKKILQKAAELIQRTGGHALAMYVDDQHTCSFYASKDTTVTHFFCQELVQKPHQRLRPQRLCSPDSLQPASRSSRCNSCQTTKPDRKPGESEQATCRR
ncbi:TPA: hypothetical protein ACH3X1_007780 [Trebouxia sp. C0004]